MPLSALHTVNVDRCVDAAEIAETLIELVQRPAGITPEIPFNIRLEAAIAAEEATGMSVEDKLGRPSHFTCPECHGTLWELDDATMLRYRCHVGHAFTGDAVLAARAGEAEQLLWSLLRSHRERAALARRMAEKESDQNRHTLAKHLMARARSYQQDADLVEQLIQSDRAAMDSGGTEPPN
jgi:two-component system chemotaxis response regulator CheB